MRYRDLLEARGRLLFHGTLADRVPDILSNGLKPMVGPLTQDWFKGKKFDKPALVFAADRRGLEKCVAVIAHQINLKLKIGRYDPLPPGAFENEGALLIIRDAKSFKRRPGEYEEVDDIHDHPRTVEPGDYYSADIVQIEDVLLGKRLMDFLARQYSIDSYFWEGIDEEIMNDIMRFRLTQQLLRACGKGDRKAVMAVMAELTPEEVRDLEGMGTAHSAQLRQKFTDLVARVRERALA